MPRGSKPGQKHGGRVKGQRNRTSVRSQDELWTYIQAQCEAGKKANPFQVLVDTMVNTRQPSLKIACAVAIADRLLPKLKAVEHSGEVRMPLAPEARQAKIAALLAKREAPSVETPDAFN